MKAQTLDISKQGSLGGQALKMRIHEDSLDFIMGVLSNLYSDPELAVIRELSVNARDSHIAAGQTRPIEITTPNWMSPFFRVQDFGLGLSMDDIEQIYSAYGASTKRDTNEQTGSLGLGSKSPLTLTDQFTVISIKDGLKISLVVSRTETGGGTMQIVDTSATDEGNGVTIIVPVQQSGTFDQKVKDFFRFWEPGTVLVNDKEPWHDEDLIKVTDSIFIKQGDRYNRAKDFIVMGGIGYPTEKLLPDSGYDRRNFSVIAHVNIGDVAFTPSREELHYTQQTNEVIERLTQEFRDNIGAVITADIDGASDRQAAWKAYTKWEGLVGSANIAVPPTYKGEDIPRSLTGKGARYTAQAYGNSRRKTIEFEDDFVIGLKEFYDSSAYYRPIFVVNLPDDKYTTYNKGKVRTYCELNGYYANRVVFTNDKSLYEHTWLPADTVVLDWDEVKKATRPATQKRATHKQFPCYNGRDWVNKDIDTTKTTVYYVPSLAFAGMNFRYMDSIYIDKVQFFKIVSNREERFNRLFPNAITIAEFAKKEKAKWDGELKWHELHHLHRSYPSWIHLMPVDKVDDPEVKAFILGAKEKSRHSEWEALNNAIVAVHQKAMPKPACPDNPLDKYPLIARLDSWSVSGLDIINEIATYMNGKFKELSA